jgi:hypothetical protein
MGRLGAEAQAMRGRQEEDQATALASLLRRAQARRRVCARRGGAMKTRTAFLLLGVIGTSCDHPIDPPAAAPAALSAPRPSRLAPGALPAEAKLLLRERMHRHAEDAADLNWAVLVLDYESVAAVARRIADEPRIGRPPPTASPDALLNARLPDVFYLVQDELETRARALSEVAERQSPNAMAAAYGALTESCVRCHAVYAAD